MFQCVQDARQYLMPSLEFEELSYCRDMPLLADACLHHHTSPSAVFSGNGLTQARRITNEERTKEHALGEARGSNTSVPPRAQESGT